MGEWCIQHHGESGLTEKVQKSPLSLKDCENQVIEFVQEWTPKGQLISKCPFGVKTSSKKPTKLFPGFCPEIFCTFLGASWKLFWDSCRLPYLRYHLLSPQEAPRKLQKNSGQNPGNNFVDFLEEVFTPKGHFEIN